VRIGIVIALCAAASASADPARFDLVGPSLEVRVTHGTRTLPIAQVPNLSAGDHVWIKADFGDEYSVHYLMVAAFLRGSTAPPPRDWFFRCETWQGKCRRQGMALTVPAEAQQLLVFLAPETGGDFKTLVSAVRGLPGVFVRTSQDLNQAAAERLRLQAYLQAIRQLGDSDPARLKEAAPMLSRSLAIKVDEKCLHRTPTLQAACLMQGQESLIMADGHGQSVTQQLTSGPASDLAMEASNTPQLKSGYYGPFVGSLLDIARLFDSFHTAKYQYIPALASPRGEELALTLNAPPSFHDPKSVLVAALPPIDSPQPPQLRPVDANGVYCAKKSPLVLPVEGAPLMFAGAYAHGLTLRISAPAGTQLELPATADAAQGGFSVDPAPLQKVDLGEHARASLHGEWGFETYDGPSFTLVGVPARPPTLAAGDEAALIVGRQDTVHLQVGSVACVSGLALSDGDGKELKVEWKPVKPDEVEARLPLEDSKPGALTLLVREHGSTEPRQLTLHAYSEAGHLDSFALRPGDNRGVLRGDRLDEVAALILKDVEFSPESLSSSGGHDELAMLAGSPPAPELKAGDKVRARVRLKDGRAYDVAVAVLPPRPVATLIGKSIRLPPAGDGRSIRLASPDELPQGGQLTFALHARVPAVFSREDRIEVATLDGSWSTVLDQRDGVTLQNSRVAVATLDPVKALGPSAFGPLRFRLLNAAGAGDWQPLATLVRLPVLTRLDCPAASDTRCELSGLNLFLLDSASADAGFAAPTPIPDGFTGQTLAVPRPSHGQLYVKLRDDPAVINMAVMEEPAAQAPALQAPPAAADAASGNPLAAAAGSGEGDAAQQHAPPPPAPPAQAQRGGAESSAGEGTPPTGAGAQSAAAAAK
jgi:hypothetical protein